MENVGAGWQSVSVCAGCRQNVAVEGSACKCTTRFVHCLKTDGLMPETPHLVAACSWLCSLKHRTSLLRISLEEQALLNESNDVLPLSRSPPEACPKTHRRSTTCTEVESSLPRAQFICDGCTTNTSMHVHLDTPRFAASCAYTRN